KPGGYGCGYLPNAFFVPPNNDKLLKDGFEIYKHDENKAMMKFYDDDTRNKIFLFEATYFYWDPEIYVESLKKAGCTNFEWIQPS
ncbi:unnamed protein product, partial [Brachionus calyciflorus]